MPVKLSMKTLPLAIAGLLGAAVGVFVLIYILWAWWSTPLFGFGAGGPDQPITFPHTVHVEQAGIQCEFCHRNVTKGDSATVPAVEQCTFCHTTINGENNVEIAKLLAHAGLNPSATPDPLLTPGPIDWKQVHRLPDHTQFAHEPHIRYFSEQADTIRKAEEMGVSPIEATCSMCHGNVREMERIKQVRKLKMGDCVDCHRDNDAPTDCTTCHY